MKKWFLTIGSILLIIVLGMGAVTLHGHSDRSYQSYVRQGRYNVIDRKYRGAMSKFQTARNVSPNDKNANRDLAQTQSYVSGKRYFSQRRLDLAAKNYRRAIKLKAIAALNHRSLAQFKLVNKIRVSSAKFTRWYDQALILNHRQKFRSSVRYLDRINDDPNVNLDYFRKFRSKVKKLSKADQKESRSNQVTSDVSRGSKSADFKLKTPKLIADHPSKVTVSKARREIRDAGVNVREMSNADVVNVIRQARQHDSNVTKYAKENY